MTISLAVIFRPLRGSGGGRAVLLAIALASNASWGWAATTLTGDVERARTKVAMCVGCHAITGYRTAFPQVYRVPKIGGQQASYIAQALTDYRDGARRYPTMRAIALALSDQDIADIAAYYAAQK